MNRRTFLGKAGGALGVAATGSTAWLTACDASSEPLGPSAFEPGTGVPLPVPGTAQTEGRILRATPASTHGGSGAGIGSLAFNGYIPGPTLRARGGDRFRVTLENGLAEKTILHWHGLDVPALADGHPRLAVGPGGSYAYDFTVRNRPGTYWYHPHPHGRTGPQVYGGLAGFLIVDETPDRSPLLPSGDRELLLLLQDKRLGAGGTPVYQPSASDRMTGFMGDVGFVNGAPLPFALVERGSYRLRILNGSNARVFDLAMSDNQPFVLVGTDGGLMDAPRELTAIFLGPGERVDVVVDFSGSPAGSTIRLHSRPFQLAGGMGMGMGMGMGSPGDQGRPMDLMEFRVRDTPAVPTPAFGGFEPLGALPSLAGARTRTFSFSSMMGLHAINGRSFEMDRVDVRIPLGAPERWRFVNQSPMPHPVHVHGGHFRVLSRSGGRNWILPWERGYKDTVLLLAGETVEVAVLFEEHRGLFLLHCHNLEHEDAGMMANFEVV